MPTPTRTRAGSTVHPISSLVLPWSWPGRLPSSSGGAVGVAIGIGVVVLALGTLLALRPNLSHDAIIGVLCILALGVVVAGVASAARGERFIEPEEHHADEGGASEGHTALTPEGTKSVTTTTAPEGDG